MTHECRFPMQNKMIAAIVCASAAAVLITTANAQPDVTWQTPITISGTSDVTNSGIYFGSWAPQDGSANTLPVNGVTFQGFSNLRAFKMKAQLQQPLVGLV